MEEIKFAGIIKIESPHPLPEDIWEYVHGWKNEDSEFMGIHIPNCDRCSKEAQRVLELDKKLGIN